MTTEEKRQVILEASKRFSAIVICPEGRGKTVSRIKKGEGVSETVLDRIYARIVALDSGNEDSTIQALDSEKPLPQERGRSEINALREENARLKAEMEKLRSEKETAIQRLDSENLGTIQSLDSNQREAIQNLDSSIPLPQGWYLVERKPSTNATAYWYAGKLIAGKQVWVYVGKNKVQAFVKIQAYLARVTGR
jgi:antitoxin (DNA-binding transcriptional repressor) of toxin-antitoxin stability system